MGCQPSVDPVPSDGEDGEGAQVEIWETCEEIPLTRRSCTGEVCSDVPVTGRQCDGLDLENCQEVPVNKLKCRQVSSIECQALRDRGGDCRYAGVEGDKHILERGPKIEASWRPAALGGLSEGDKPPVAGGMQAFEICDDFPKGEVCREVEMEVCHASKDAEEEKLCREVEMKKCLTDMVDECTVEPICNPLPVVETCEEVPGGFLLSCLRNLAFLLVLLSVTLIQERRSVKMFGPLKRQPSITSVKEIYFHFLTFCRIERTCGQKILCCGDPCPVEERPKKVKPWKKDVWRSTQLQL